MVKNREKSKGGGGVGFCRRNSDTKTTLSPIRMGEGWKGRGQAHETMVAIEEKKVKKRVELQE